MKSLKDIRLKGKIILIIVSISFFSAVAGNIVDYYLEMRQTKKQLVEETKLYARLISEYCRLPLEFNYKEVASEVMQKLSNLPSVKYGVLLDKNNEVFASYPINNIADFQNKPELNTKNYILDGNFIVVKESVISNDKEIGTIYLRTEIIWKNIVWREAFVSLLVISIVLVITLIMASFPIPAI